MDVFCFNIGDIKVKSKTQLYTNIKSMATLGEMLKETLTKKFSRF